MNHQRVRELPESQQAEQWLADHNLQITVRLRGRLAAILRDNGHSVEEWLDSSIRTLRLPQQLRELLNAIGGHVWRDDPSRIVQVGGCQTGRCAPYLIIEDERVIGNE